MPLWVVVYLVLSWAPSWSWWWWGWWGARHWSQSLPGWCPSLTTAQWPNPTGSTYTHRHAQRLFNIPEKYRTRQNIMWVLKKGERGWIAQDFMTAHIMVGVMLISQWILMFYITFVHNWPYSRTTDLAEELVTAHHYPKACSSYEYL